MKRSKREILNAVPVDVKVGMIGTQIDELCQICFQCGSDKEVEVWSQEIKRIRNNIDEMLSSIKGGVKECRTTSSVEAAS